MTKELRDNLQKMLAICLTPMTKDQKADPAGLKRHLRFMMERGGLNSRNSMMIINGSTAEAHSLSVEERKQLLEAAMEEINGAMGVVAGCQHTDINVVVELMKHAREVGASCAMVLPPYYYKASREGLIDFYSRISDRCDMDIVIYNNITATGIDIPVEWYKDLIQNARIAGVKECTNDFSKMAETVAETGDQMVIISGHGIIYEPYSAMAGVHTFNSSEACFAPAFARKVWELRRDGRWVEEKEMRDRLRPYFKLVSEISAVQGANGVIALIKYLTMLAGSRLGPGKTPVVPLSEQQKKHAEEVMKEIGIFEQEGAYVSDRI